MDVESQRRGVFVWASMARRVATGGVFGVMIAVCAALARAQAPPGGPEVQALVEKLRQWSVSLQSGRVDYEQRSQYTADDAVTPVVTRLIKARFRGEDAWVRAEGLGGIEAAEPATLTTSVLGGEYAYRLDRPTPTEPDLRGEVVTSMPLSARQEAPGMFSTPQELFSVLIGGKPALARLEEGSSYALKENGQDVLSHWSTSRGGLSFDVYFHPDGQLDHVVECGRFGFSSPSELSAALNVAADEILKYRMPFTDTYYMNYLESGGVRYPSQVVQKNYHASKIPAMRALNNKIRNAEATWVELAPEAVKIYAQATPAVVTTITCDPATLALNVPISDDELKIDFGVGAMIHNAKTGETIQVQDFMGTLAGLAGQVLTWCRVNALRLVLVASIALGAAGLWLRQRKTASA